MSLLRISRAEALRHRVCVQVRVQGLGVAGFRFQILWFDGPKTSGGPAMGSGSVMSMRAGVLGFVGSCGNSSNKEPNNGVM
jgi:hypothetical protein